MASSKGTAYISPAEWWGGGGGGAGRPNLLVSHIFFSWSVPLP